MKGTLYLIPSSMGEGTPHSLYNEQSRLLIQRIHHFITEKTKTSRRFIRFLDKEKDIDSCFFYELNKHQEFPDHSDYLTPLLNGEDMILMSEAGSPAIADPGGSIVKMAHHKEIKVSPIPGPSSIYMALMASGLNGQHFQFHGYLPKSERERKKALMNIENKAITDQSAEIFMETPYRSQHLFNDILKNCGNNTLLCLAVNVALPNEYIMTKSISNWKKVDIDLKNQLCIFIIGK